MYEYKPRRIIRNEEGIRGRTQFVYSIGLQHLFKHVDSDENNAIKICAEVIKFKIETNTYPNAHSKDKNETILGRWLCNMRSAKQGKGHSKFYPSLEPMAIKAGFPDMFNIIDLEATAYKKCMEAIKFTQEHGKYPNTESKDKNEKILGRWISTMRKSKKGKCKTKFYPILDRMAIDAGYPDMFNNIDLEATAYKKCKEVIEFMQEHSRCPSKESRDNNEKTLGQWVCTMRKTKQGKSGVFYPLLDKMVIDAGYPDIFNNIDREQEAIDKCKEVISFTQKHGRYPNKRSKDKNEKTLGLWISNMKRANKGTKQIGVFYPILEQMVIKAGFPDMFNIIDLEAIAYKKCTEVIEFIQEHGKHPNPESNDNNEKTLCQWICNMRCKKKSTKKGIFYPILDKMVANAKLPNMFNANWKDDLK